MSDENSTEDGEAEKKKSGLPLMIAIVGALVLGGAAFGGVYFFLPREAAEEPYTEHAEAPKDYDWDAPKATAQEASVYYELEPLVISLSPAAKSKHLHIGMTLEIAESDYSRLDTQIPRIRDVLTTYLRAVEERDLEDPAAMTRLRAQILRRLSLVASDIDIRTLLITEYLLS